MEGGQGETQELLQNALKTKGSMDQKDDKEVKMPKNCNMKD